MMNEETYFERRTQLVKEFWFNKSKRCYLVCKARIRAIAKLDLEYKGVPKEETLKKFKYDQIKLKE